MKQERVMHNKRNRQYQCRNLDRLEFWSLRKTSGRPSKMWSFDQAAELVNSSRLFNALSLRHLSKFYRLVMLILAILEIFWGLWYKINWCRSCLNTVFITKNFNGKAKVAIGFMTKVNWICTCRLYPQNRFLWIFT